MTALHLQELDIEDCEQDVQRAYYEWGMGAPDDEGTVRWEEATPERRRRTALLGYDLYDGWPVQPGNEIGPLEAYVSVGINSFVIAYDVVRFVSRADRARPLLAQIPDAAELENATADHLAAAAKLIELFEEAPHLGRGKATKVLHKKRPAFVPVIDSRVSHFLWRNFPHRLSERAPIADVLSLYRELLLARRVPLLAVQKVIAPEGFRISTARLLSFLIWHAWGKRYRGENGPTIAEVWGTTNPAEVKSRAQSQWDAQGLAL